ncbi:MAG: NAD(P)H-hydrate dehydratase [Deltaproteobacteria bacterium]|nr:NAD(P)H-hydrate dehydratase [Deltaproteobacteria bacterium]
MGLTDGQTSGPIDAEGLELVATQAEVRAIDHAAIHDWGIPGRLLMELAGAGAARVILERLGRAPGAGGKAVVLAGPGNNGGDGWVVARHLACAGWTVRVIATGEPREGGDAHPNYLLWQRLAPSVGGETRFAERGATARMKNWLGHANVIVDAIFGTGLQRPIEGAAADLIAAANDADHGVKVALDVPSGLDSDRGAVLGAAFRADLTLTFGLPKIGLHLLDGPRHAGEIVVLPIGWPTPAIDAVGASHRRATPSAIARLLPARPADGHKGTFGHVGVLGGFAGKEGAAVLAGLGALRSGAGLCTWVRPAPDTRSEVEPVTRPPELMVEALAARGPLPARPTVLVVGPGLGDAPEVVDRALSDGRPLVLDADALNLLAARAALGLPGHVLTPHPLEAARLLGLTAADVQADRPGAARALVARTGAVVVLKGAGTIVAAPDAPPVLVDVADPTLAVGGSGDVLAGLIAGLLAQGAPPRAAAIAGVALHALAGRELGRTHAQRGVLAHELADALPGTIANLLAGWT